MIPVDEKEARKPKGRCKDGWAMPYEKLLAELRVRTEGRVLRADQDLSAPASGKVPGRNDEKLERWQAFQRATVVHPATVEIDGKQVSRTLYIEHTVQAAPAQPPAPRARGPSWRTASSVQELSVP